MPSNRSERTSPRQPGTRVSFGRKLVTFALLSASCGMLLNVLVGPRGLPAIRQARSEYDAIAADLDRVRADNARLRQEVQHLREDPDTIEEIARRDLGLISPGEKVFIIRDLAPPAPQNSPAPK
jgi:cell division protein FtsB